MAIHIGDGEVIGRYLGSTAIGRVYLGSSVIWEAPASTGYLSTSDRILFSGHSLVDAIFSGSGDSRPTMTELIPGSRKTWRRSTVPGSTLQIRWGWRNGGDDHEGFPDPLPPPPDWDSEFDRWPIPGLDLPEFDAILITEGGPYALPLNPDRFNSGWNGSADYLDRWWMMARDSGIPPGKFLFWTIWPGTEFVKDAEDDPALPDFMAYLKRYGTVAEEWCRKRGIRIIPGHRIWEELYARLHDGRLPGAFEDIMADTIHPNFLGSIFTAVGCYRHLFGEMPATARIQALLDQEPGHAFTVQHVLDVVTATLDYVQGPGIDLQYGTYQPPAPFWNAALPPGPQGFTTVGTYTVGQEIGPGNGIWKDLPAPPTTQFAILEITLQDGNDFVWLAGGMSKSRGMWDSDWLGASLHGDGGNAFIALREGDQWQMMVRPKPWTGSPAILLCIATTEAGSTIRDLADPGWMSQVVAHGARPPADVFAVNALFDGGAAVPGLGNFAVSRGVYYPEWPTDKLTRMRLIAHFCGGTVP